MKYLIAGLTLFFTLPGLANDEHDGFYLGMELSNASLNVSTDYELDAFRNDSTASVGLRLGYKWKNNWIAELRGSNTGNGVLLGLSDHIELSQAQYLLGYSFSLSERVDFVPMVGWSDWKLTTTEGRLFNPGLEESELVNEGEDIFLRLGLDYNFNKTISISTYYTRWDFGEVQATDIAMGLRLKY